MISSPSNNKKWTTTDMVDDLRNKHVKKLLNKLGGRTAPEHLQIAIKRAFSEFAEDINTGIKDNNYETEQQEDRPST